MSFKHDRIVAQHKLNQKQRFCRNFAMRVRPVKDLEGQNQDRSGRPDKYTEQGNGRKKFRPSRKQPKKSRLKLIALQA